MMKPKSNNIINIPVDKEFAKYFKIRASMKGISRLELSRLEANNMKQVYEQLNSRKNEENKFPFRF